MSVMSTLACKGVTCIVDVTVREQPSTTGNHWPKTIAKALVCLGKGIDMLVGARVDLSLLHFLLLTKHCVGEMIGSEVWVAKQSKRRVGTKQGQEAF
jgi:hypothetical protein